jgi:hypothetical protein
MNPLTPFPARHAGPDVVWPQRTGPDLEPRRHARRPEIWERTVEAFAGETVLEDLRPGLPLCDATLILARYETARLAIHAATGSWNNFSPLIETTAAREYLDAVLDECPEARWLDGVVDSLQDAGIASPVTVSRLAAAAAVASRADHMHGAFALWRIAWEVARSLKWHAQAARIARSIAIAAGRAGGVRSQRLWSRRARVHARRAAD